MSQSKPKVSIRHCIDFNLSAFQLKMQVWNTINGSTRRASNHNCKNIRLHVESDERNTFSAATTHCTTAKTVCTDVSLNTSSRPQVYAWKSAKPGLRYRNNKGENTLSPRTAQVHSCRNTLRLCVNGLPVTRCRALQVCAWNVAQPALVDINKQGGKTH